MITRSKDRAFRFAIRTTNIRTTDLLLERTRAMPDD